MAANDKALAEKAKRCLSKAAPIPASPLWHMRKAGAFGSQDSFDIIQKALDYLDCKAKFLMPLNKDEKEFLIEMFEAFSWGGWYKGWSEASKLVNHYVHGHGVALQIDAEVYKTSVIVKDTMTAMKQYIRELFGANKPFSRIRSDDFGFINKSYFSRVLLNNKRSAFSQGYVDNTGLIFAEQANHRLQKADNRFYLEARTVKLSDINLRTYWRVDNIYRFRKQYFTLIPIREGMELKISDGLAKYIEEIGLAKEFDYWAEWQETWSL